MKRFYEKHLVPYLLILPAMTLVVVFGLIPVVQNVEISLHKWNFVTQKTYVAFKNYKDLFTSYSLFPKVIKNTFFYALLKIPPTIILSLSLALLLTKGVFGQNVFRGLFFVPWIVPTVNIAFLWMYILEPEYGLVNFLLGKLGILGPGWFYSVNWALPALGLISIWKGIGYFSVLYIGGLQNIPQEMYEVAEIDGAGPLKKLVYITLPLLSSTTLFVLVILVIETITEFDLPAVLTDGGPANSTNLLVYYIYQRAFNAFQGGSAAAISTVTLVMLLIFTISQFRLSTKWVHYEI
ncbi:MAG: sugar ABC transporter permease [Firmicutes bacterium]|nr:sugar ABC transporter permease [Bacillota bacterium]